MNLFIRAGSSGNPGPEILQQDGFAEGFLPNVGDTMMINDTQHTVTQRVFGYAGGVYTAELFVG